MPGNRVDPANSLKSFVLFFFTATRFRVPVCIIRTLICTQPPEIMYRVYRENIPVYLTRVVVAAQFSYFQDTRCILYYIYDKNKTDTYRERERKRERESKRKIYQEV